MSVKLNFDVDEADLLKAYKLSTHTPTYVNASPVPLLVTDFGL